MWLLIVVLALPLIEIGLFVQIGGMIGVWWTLAWVLLAGFLGVIVLKGIASLGPVSLGQKMRDMSDPLSPLAHRAMVTIAGTLLVIPGFLTDVVGLALLIPPFRTLVIRLVARRLERSGVQRQTTVTVIDGEWQEVDPNDGARPANPPQDQPRH